MAGSDPKKEAKRQSARPASGGNNSRVSKAAGSQGSPSVQSMKADQRAGSSANVKQSGRGQVAKQISRGKQEPSQSAANAQHTKKSPVRQAQTPLVSPPDPKDVTFIKWVQEKWHGLEAHQQQQIFGSVLLLLSLLLFASLTIFNQTPIFQPLYQGFLVFFGWSSYLLAIGLIAFALAHLIEGMRKQRLIRWSMVVGLLFIWLLLLIESRLIINAPTVGVLAELLVRPLLGWPVAVQHMLTLGLLLIALIFTFRITFGHILMVAHTIQRITPSRHEPTAAEKTRERFLGQRPRFSRYTASSMGVASEAKPARSGKRPVEDDEDLEDEDEETIAFEADFDEDPLNDINIHKQQVGMVSRGSRVPQTPDPAGHKAAVQGVSQQALPFDASQASAPAQGKKKNAKQQQAMEPLAPNPLLLNQKQRGAAPAPLIASIWKLPDIGLLNSPETTKLHMMGDDTEALARTIQETLRSFRVDAEVRQEDISIGPTVIRFGIRPTGKPELIKDEKTGKMVPVRDTAGNIIYEVRTRVSRIMALQNDLALVLEAKTIRMEAPVPGRPYVGVEIPNKNSRLVTLREVLESKEYLAAKAKSKIAVGLGKDVAGQVRVGDLARMPHLLIAGATGAGKSVCINTIIASILTQATPDDVRLLMVDPKMVELNMYGGIPHLLSPVVTEVERVVPLLKNAINEMERRYRLFSQLGVRNLDGYRKLRLEKFSKGDTSLNNLPAIVIIIDELADLMMAAPEEVEGMICRLAQLARATGIHLVVATQRPSVDVITGLIKANIPTRISFMVSSAVDSRTIIDMGGAERLLGRGDMLYLPADAGRPERIQGSFLADEEAEALVAYWRQQVEEYQRQLAAAQPVQEEQPASLPAVEPGWEIVEHSSDDLELDDELLEKAEEVVREYGRASISLLQRRLRVGYSRAARLIDLLEEHGIIGQFEPGGKAREVLEGNGDYDRRAGDGHTLADEVADIVAEERARNEFLRKQAANQRTPRQQNDDA